MGIPLLKRLSMSGTCATSRVLIINETLAEIFPGPGPDRSAANRKLGAASRDEIIGVVGDIKETVAGTGTESAIYVAASRASRTLHELRHSRRRSIRRRFEGAAAARGKFNALDPDR